MNRRYAEASATLRELADRLATLADHPTLDGAPTPYLTMHILPAPDGRSSATHQAWVDVIAAALAADTPVAVRHQPSLLGGEIYAADVRLGTVSVAVQAAVPAQEDSSGSPDDLRDHAEEHAVARDYVAEYGPELDAEAGGPDA